MVGDSADQSARRLREKTNRVIETRRRDERWDVEGRAASALRVLPGDEWTVFEHVHLPGRRFAGIDHVAVGPPGVFVVQTKLWTGQVSVVNGILRLDGRRRAALTAQASEAAHAVAQLVPEIAPTQVQGVLCFLGTVQVAGWSQSTLVCNTGNIASLLTSRPPVLDEEVREGVVRRLEQQLVEDRPSPQHAEQATASRRSSVLRTMVAPLVGGIAALGLVAVLLTHPDLVHDVGDFVVSIVDHGDAPQEPTDKHHRDRRDGRG